MNPFDKRPGWEGATIAILGSGPSLTLAQIEHARRGADKVIAINRSYELATWADVIYAGDYNFWKHYHERIREACPLSEFWTMDGAASDYFNIRRARGNDEPGFGTDTLHSGGNSGYQAINLAIVWGAARILLLGFDMKPAEDGRKHFFGDHEPGLLQQSLFDEWLHKFNTVKSLPAGVEVINCTPGSALNIFPRGEISELLP